MCLPTPQETKLLLLNIKISKAKEELKKRQEERQQQRKLHEKRMEGLFQHMVAIQQRIEFRKKNFGLANYIEAVAADKHSSPYLIRKYAFLCQVFHQNEVEVKQLQMVKRQHEELSNWMTVEGDTLYDERNQLERELLDQLHSMAFDFKKKEIQYKRRLAKLRGEVVDIAGDDKSIQTEVTQLLKGKPWEEAPDDATMASGTSASLQDSVSSIIDHFGGIAKGMFSVPMAASSVEVAGRHAGDMEQRAGSTAALGMTLLKATDAQLERDAKDTSPKMHSGLSLSGLVYQGIRNGNEPHALTTSF